MHVVRPRQGSAPVKVVFPFRRGVGDHVGRTQSLSSVGLGDAFHMPALSDEGAVGWKAFNPVQHRDGKQTDRVILLVRILQLALQFRGEVGHLPACVVITGLRQIFEYGGAAAFPQAKKGCRGDVLGSGLQRPPACQKVFINGAGYDRHFPPDVILVQATVPACLDDPVLDGGEGGQSQACQDKALAGGARECRHVDLC